MPTTEVKDIIKERLIRNNVKEIEIEEIQNWKGNRPFRFDEIRV
jgi:hypothetical protein